MKKEFNFKNAKKGARANKANTKVAISLRLDSDVIVWLREESEEKSIPYQTLINSLLKQSMKGSSDRLRAEIKKVLKEEKEAS